MGGRIVNNAYMSCMLLYQKVKEAEYKLKRKIYYVKNTIKQSVSHAKYKFHRNKKLNRAGSYVSIVIALLIITFSWLTTINWLFWAGVVSILSNAFLLIIQSIIWKKAIGQKRP
ncbi:hypothetical protein ACQKM9_13980 [Viridibacillus sp. NPDC093762]|uniref:hypothetical protein n=1 Tax=Viridibacillus sp. NPDC093762 TaxID=3390720 RepID=UPI003D069999